MTTHKHTANRKILAMGKKNNNKQTKFSNECAGGRDDCFIPAIQQKENVFSFIVNWINFISVWFDHCFRVSVKKKLSDPCIIKAKGRKS